MASRDEARAKLYDAAERQAGYFTSAQARAAGYSHALQHYHHKVGNWRKERWGLYRLARFPSTPGEDLVRLMLWSRDRSGRTRAVVSHESALQAYELSDVLPAKVHLTVPKAFRKRPPSDVVLHRGDVPAEDVRERDGVLVTTPLRTLLDVAASPSSPEHLEDAARAALGRGLVRRDALERALRDAPETVRARFERVGVA
ncbi:MAG: type IV toxin-antitoxin system AbiEi family antitoxin [Actinomycetota bacterium]